MMELPCERAGAEYFPVASKLRSAPPDRSLRNVFNDSIG